MRKEKRKTSAGTVIVLILMLLVLGGTAAVITQLSPGTREDTVRPGGTEPTPAALTPVPEIPASAEKAPTAAPASTPAREESGPRTLTLTLGGTTAMNGDLRKHSYYSEVKQYDFYDMMTLLRKELRSDLNIVFLENILTEEGTLKDGVSNAAAAAMLQAAGFNMAACGFSGAYDRKAEGIASTRKILLEHGIGTTGIYEADGPQIPQILEINGIRICLLQYTGNISSSTRKGMAKQGTTRLVPPEDTDIIAEDIAAARAQGSDAVIVLLQWGKAGSAPDRARRALVQEIADAGADLIVGCGSRIVSGAETLTAAGTGREVLCVWSLGTLLSGDRSNPKRTAGMLLHVTVTAEDGRVSVGGFSYTPVYTWKYRMDGRYYYRCLASNGSVPDGMNQEERKKMNQAADIVRKAMKGAPVEERPE